MESPLFCLQPTFAYQQMHQPKGGRPHVNGYQHVTGRTESSHQHTRAESSAFSHIDFYKIPNSSDDTCPDGQ